MNLGTHMPDGERRKPIDIEVCRSKVKVYLYRHCPSISSQRGFRTFGALLIFIIFGYILDSTVLFLRIF